MKKRNLFFLTLTLTAILLLCAFAFSANAEETAPAVSIDKFNLVFEDNVYLKYAVRFDGVDDEKITSNDIGMLYFTSPQSDYTVGGENYSSKVVGYTTIQGEKYYTFEYRHISAKQMTDYIYSVAYVELDGVKYYSAPAKYSVLDYAYSCLGKTGVATDNEDLKNLLTATLEQGAMAQKYFKYNTERLANADYYLVEVVDGTLEDGFSKGLYHSGEKVIATATSTDKVCCGWQNSSGIVVSQDNPAELSCFWKNETYSPVWENIEIPEPEDAYTRDGNYIYFGEYPQTIKANDVQITDTVDSRGYYLGADGEYYAKVVSNPYNDSYTFSNGDSVKGGKEFYFKVEPIRWRILEEKNGEAFILCDSIIANMPYQSSYNSNQYGNEYTTANGAPEGTYANNYEYSDVRLWLNDHFFNTSFNDLQKSLISTTMVDNSAESTGNINNPYACSETKDKIFLLSYLEVTDSKYGFATSGSIYDAATRIYTSDYSRATGATMSTSSDYYVSYGNGCWWLRSSDVGDGSDARAIGYYGSHISATVCISWFGVVPALRIRLDDTAEPETPNYSEGLAFASNGDGTCSVSGIGNCTDTNLNIPPISPDGDIVVSISDRAFMSDRNITTLIIPDTVTSIGMFAFEDCTSLVKLIINGEETSLLYQAFYGCYSLKEIYINSNIKSIRESDDVFDSAGFGADVIFGKDVVEITANLFRSAEIKSVSFEEGSKCTTIGDYAFYGCYELVSVELPECLTNIGNDAFYNCKKIKEVVNNSELNVVAGGNEYGKVALYAIEVHSGESKLIILDEFVFYKYDGENHLISYCGEQNSRERELRLPENCNGEEYVIDVNAFSTTSWSSIKKLIIPSAVKSIKSGAFGSFNAGSDFDIIICKGITDIASDAFSMCGNIKNIYFTGSEAEFEQIGWAIPNSFKGTIHYNYIP